MCGITGYITRDIQGYNLDNCLSLLKHRGPDGAGKFYDDNVGLGHTRLSIIDLSESANQPYSSNCERYIIVFNGEIYNYKELSALLTNVHLRTTSDTEILLNLYIQKGVSCLNLLEGMFAFAIYDKEEKTIFCARDHLGIKPFYYTYDEHKCIFGSEIKALFSYEGVRKEIDENAYTEFLLNGFLYEPDTGFKNIKKLKPGCYGIMKITAEGGISFKETRYWYPGNKTVSKNPIDQLIQSSIKSHLISDVPVGLFFSGGVDSSILLQEVKGQIAPIIVKSAEADYKEAGMKSDYYYANKIAKKFATPLEEIELTQVVNSSESFLASINELSKLTEEPIVDYTFISSQYLSRISNEKGYKVMLSGMGADELFAGYPRYKLVKYANFFNFFTPIINLFFGKTAFFSKKIERFNTFFMEKGFGMKYTSLIGVFNKKELSKNLLCKFTINKYKQKINKIIEEVAHLSDLKKAMYLDIYGFLSHNFLVADKSSMQESIELRVPLATKRLMEFAFQQEDKQLISIRENKKILKKYLGQFLPASIVHRRKAGFNPPMDKFINRMNAQQIIGFCEKNKLFDIIKKEYVQNLVANHFSKKDNNTYKIYTLLYLSAWHFNNK